MRRITFTILLFVLISLLIIEGYAQDGIPCDANGSGSITAADVTALINDLRNRAPAAGNADCNGSGTVTAADVTALINVLRGRTQPPPESDVSCPCNFDLEFWTRDQWVLTDNGLFDSCRSVSDITEIVGAETDLDEIGNGFQCSAVHSSLISLQILLKPYGDFGINKLNLFLKFH